MIQDRVGLGWRGPLAASIYVHRDAVDVIELIADDYFKASRRVIRSLRALARDIPTLCHGVSLGPASVLPIERRRVENLARFINSIEPVMWSEHLAFVRAGGYEIGHLAAPPRNARTIEGTIRNIQRMRAAVGSAPALENIATLIDPPDSHLSEPEWNGVIAADSDCPLLLDLHNLYANSVNFGIDPWDNLRRFRLERVRIVHLSGGQMIEALPDKDGVRQRRLLDDHLHDVPEVVFAMLTEVAEHTSQPLTVIIERDGHYPQFSVLMEQMQRARAALAAGRENRASSQRRTAAAQRHAAQNHAAQGHAAQEPA